MKMKLFALGVCCMTLTFTGCISTLDGKHVAGWPIAADTVEGRYERPMNQVWSAAKDTLAFNGVLTVENVVGKTLEAKVDTRTVWVAVEALSPEGSLKPLTRVLVQVRTKGGGTDKTLASEIDKQIAVRLAANNPTPSRSR